MGSRPAFTPTIFRPRPISSRSSAASSRSGPRSRPWPGGPELPKWYSHTLDPFVGLAAAAAVTTKLRLGTGICLLTEHDPMRLRAPEGRDRAGEGTQAARAGNRKAEAALEEAKRDHETKVEEMEGDRAALDRRAQAEDARWAKQKEKLETALRRARD